jgi:hypothetical protein
VPPGHGIQDGHDPGSDPQADGEVSGPRRIFVWNPGAPAESFPDAPPGENHKR